MKKRIWFNRWFNTAYHLINLIKNNHEGVQFEVFGTHPNAESAMLAVCDYVEVEPRLCGRDYVDYCISFCKKHRIDIFVPKYQILHISEYIKEFNSIGTLVLVSGDTELLKIIDDKPKFYDLCKCYNIVELPQYYVVNTADEFMKAYKVLQSEGHRVCIKPVNSEGGFGFRIIDDESDQLVRLFGELSTEITSDEVYRILASKDSFPDLMVLEYLDGFEYSIDCLAYEGTLFAAVPRKKLHGRVRLLEHVPELLEIAQKISKVYKLPYVFNIQVKYKNGVPKLLEINTRMSGGLHISCMSGVNFPYLAIKLLQGQKIDIQNPSFNIMVTQLDKEIEIKR